MTMKHANALTFALRTFNTRQNELLTKEREKAIRNLMEIRDAADRALQLLKNNPDRAPERATWVESYLEAYQTNCKAHRAFVQQVGLCGKLIQACRSRRDARPPRGRPIRERTHRAAAEVCKTVQWPRLAGINAMAPKRAIDDPHPPVIR